VEGTVFEAATPTTNGGGMGYNSCIDYSNILKQFKKGIVFQVSCFDFPFCCI